VITTETLARARARMFVCRLELGVENFTDSLAVEMKAPKFFNEQNRNLQAKNNGFATESRKTKHSH
jgi:hypothetical protein